MNFYDWSEHTANGYYAKAVLVVMANDLEEARQVAWQTVYEHQLDLWRCGDQSLPSAAFEQAKKKADAILASVITNNPRVWDRPRAFYQSEAE